MKKLMLLGLLLMPTLCALCQSRPADIHQIEAVLFRQQDAWNRGDPEAFMQGYWRSDSLMFVSSAGVSYGWQEVLDRYKRNYPNPEAMGKLSFTVKHLDALSDSAVFMIGQWSLKRLNDSVGGHFSLLWKKIDGNWVIVADHSS